MLWSAERGTKLTPSSDSLRCALPLFAFSIHQRILSGFYEIFMFLVAKRKLSAAFEMSWARAEQIVRCANEPFDKWIRPYISQFLCDAHTQRVCIKYVLRINNSIFIFTFVVSSHCLVTRKFNLFHRFWCRIFFSLPLVFLSFLSVFFHLHVSLSFLTSPKTQLVDDDDGDDADALKTMLTLKFDNAARSDINWKLDSKLYLMTNEVGWGIGCGNWSERCSHNILPRFNLDYIFYFFFLFLFLGWTIDNQITSKCGYIESQYRLYYMCVCVA